MKSKIIFLALTVLCTGSIHAASSGMNGMGGSPQGTSTNPYSTSNSSTIPGSRNQMNQQTPSYQNTQPGYQNNQPNNTNYYQNEYNTQSIQTPQSDLDNSQSGFSAFPRESNPINNDLNTSNPVANPNRNLDSHINSK